jgi:hypothetical protein
MTCQQPSASLEEVTSFKRPFVRRGALGWESSTGLCGETERVYGPEGGQ